MYTVQSIQPIYSEHCRVYSTVYSVHYNTEYILYIQCTVYSLYRVKYKLYSMHYNVYILQYIIHCTVYSPVYSAQYIIQCTVYSPV